MTEPKPLQQIDRTYVRFEGRKLSYFAGCDYFRMASHPKVLRAVNEGMKKYGLNVAASRMTTGNHELFGKLEKSLSQFFEAESATLVSNGYVTNLIVAQALAGEFSHILIDEKSHPSLKDAAKLFQIPIHPFQHCDVQNMQRVAKSLGRSAKICLLTDGMFSFGGAIAPLAAYLQALPKNAWLLVDDAHGAVTLGATGKGALELEQVSRERVIQTMTLSKAVGVYGGAILGSNSLREKILARSGMFVGSTPPPLPLVYAAQAALHILQKEKGLRKRLVKNVAYVKDGLSARKNTGLESPVNRQAGKPALHSGLSPIIPIIPASSEEAEQIKKRCWQNGVFPSFIKYPGGPENGYFRFVLSSEHSKTQLDALIGSIIIS